MIALFTMAWAGSLTYHAGGQYSRSDGEAIERLRAERTRNPIVSEQLEHPAWGLGHAHSLTWSPEGQRGIYGLDPSVRLGLALGKGPRGAEYRMGDLDVVLPAPLWDTASVTLNLYWPTVDVFPADLHRKRWSSPNVFVGPLFFWEDGRTALYVNPMLDPLWPLVRALLGAGPFRLHARLLAGGTLGVADWLYLSAEANAVLTSSFEGIPGGELSVRGGLGFRY